LIIVKPPFDYARFCAARDAAFPCRHNRAQIRNRRDARGRVRLSRQCADCGKRLSRELRYVVLENQSPQTVRDWDFAAEAEFLRLYLAFSYAERADINRERSAQWWHDYIVYLQTDDWRARSRVCIASAGGICSYCYSRPAIEAHHISYDRVGHELPTDLRATCRKCHSLIHAET
jgi:hypothetical protein